MVTQVEQLDDQDNNTPLPILLYAAYINNLTFHMLNMISISLIKFFHRIVTKIAK